MLNMFAAFAEFERGLMRERQKEGIAKAKAGKKYKGRKPTARAKAGEAVVLYKQQKSVSEIAASLGIGRGSVYRALSAGCGRAGIRDHRLLVRHLAHATGRLASQGG